MKSGCGPPCAAAYEQRTSHHCRGPKRLCSSVCQEQSHPKPSLVRRPEKARRNSADQNQLLRILAVECEGSGYRYHPHCTRVMLASCRFQSTRSGEGPPRLRNKIVRSRLQILSRVMLRLNQERECSWLVLANFPSAIYHMTPEPDSQLTPTFLSIHDRQRPTLPRRSRSAYARHRRRSGAVDAAGAG